MRLFTKYCLNIVIALFSSMSTKSVLPKIFLRNDQNINDMKNKLYQNENVLIVAPLWVKEGLKKLSEHIPSGTQFELHDSNGKQMTLSLNKELTLKDLLILARNEPINVNGEINFNNYEPTFKDRSVIYAFKDLVRQCVIVAEDNTTHYGGYPRGNQRVEQNKKVYVADLVGLQFQQDYNSGRLVLISQNLPKGLLDEFIFNKVVGEDKISYKTAESDTTGRYVKHNDVYFDTYAYQKFVANDVVITGLAFNEISKENLNFKFLKYGTGFFAGPYREILEKNIYKGVERGLDNLLSMKCQKWIKSVELPFYDYNKDIDNVCKKYEIKCEFSKEDALKQTNPDYVTATTNCADPHAMTGNEMGYSSVDAAIAQNIESKANIFSPLINKLIKEKFISISDICLPSKI